MEIIKYSNYTIPIPNRYKNKTLEDYNWEENKNLKNIIINFVIQDNYPEKGIWLYGMVGVGKTFLLSVIYRILRYIYGSDVEYIEFQNLLASLRVLIKDAEKFEEVINFYSSIPYLIVDDIFDEYCTESDLKNFSRIVNGRYNNNYNLICSSNVDKKGLLETKSSMHLISRLVGMCEFIQVNGKDNRI